MIKYIVLCVFGLVAFAEQPEPTDNYLALTATLLELRIIGDEHLLRMIDGQLNPILKSEAQIDTPKRIAKQAYDDILASLRGGLSDEAIQKWSKERLSQEEKERQDKKNKQEETKNLWKGLSGCLAVGDSFSYAIDQHNNIRQWGLELSSNRKIRINIGPIKTITSYGTNTFVIKNDDTLECWGQFCEQYPIPTNLGKVRAISINQTSFCAIKADETLVCWGNNRFHNLDVPPNLGILKSVTAGFTDTWAVQADGNVVTSSLNDSTPKDIGPAKSIVAGDKHACAHKEDDSVMCWKYFSFDKTQAHLVPPDLGQIIAITAGKEHTCAIRKKDRNVVCWGSNKDGRSTPPADLGPVQEIVSSQEHTCAIQISGFVKCWGLNHVGETDVPTDLGPILPPLTEVKP